jgi:hypothetical protein
MHTVEDIPLERLAAVALANVGTEYPFHLTHLARGDDDLRPPRSLHPLFHGAYDWHSSAHMHWTLARCLRLGLRGGTAAAIAAHFEARLTPAAAAGECAYFTAEGRATFERPYGWAWLLLLAAELDALAATLPAAARWRDALAPLAVLLGGRLQAWLARAEYPVRAGTHGNSAFALLLAWQYARRRDGALAEALGERARRWYGDDRRYPADYEPGGDDFLSGGLCEALLMARLMTAAQWASWWSEFAPADAALTTWLAPARVSDPADARIVHLHGLNLSRAWCWRQLLPLLPAPRRAAAAQAAQAHLQASAAAAIEGDYVGTHWLASFVLLARTGEAVAGC